MFQYIVSYRSHKLMGFTAGSVRFVVRSFFVGPVEQPHVDKVAEKFGGPQMQARFYNRVTRSPIPTSAQVNGSRKSVTLSWAKHGGLKESWESQKISGVDCINLKLFCTYVYTIR